MRCGVTVIDNMLFLLNSVKFLDRVGPKSFLHSSMTMNNKESLSTDRFERLNFEQLLYKSLFTQLLLARLHKKNNSCKVSRPRSFETETDTRPRGDLKPSSPRLEKTGFETRLETETKSRDSITATRQESEKSKS